MIKSTGVKLLSKTTIRKIRRMIAAVLAEPELYDQNTFGENRCVDKDANICGTVCCAAGWAIWLENRELYSRMMKSELRGGGPEWISEALKALDLSSDGEGGGAHVLFGPSGSWPEPFCEQYYEASTPKARAKVFAARWEKFIQSDGQV